MNEKNIFKDQIGHFEILKPTSWELIENEQSETDIYSFKISENGIFNISCLPIDSNPLFAKIIERENLEKHDFSLPNLSFVEKYENINGLNCYTWLSVVDDLLCMANFQYRVGDIPGQDISLLLMEIRTHLRLIRFPGKKELYPKATKKQDSIDYLDIANWTFPQVKFYDYWAEKEKSSSIRISPFEIDVVSLYALLKSKVSAQPNGIFDSVRRRKPLDNPIWWDFVLECDKGFIHIWRTSYMVEATLVFEDQINLKEFFEYNFKKYSQTINQTKDKFERHSVYVNHFDSYKNCVDTLWKEIKEIDLNAPKTPREHLVKKTELTSFELDLRNFTENSIRYHALAKSLVLNAAFKIESFLNLLIRIGARKELSLYPEILNKFLRQQFSHRIKNLQFYTQIFIKPVDTDSNIYRETIELMTLRNKYVHYDEDKIYNKLGEIFYDRDYPLMPTNKDRPAVEAVKQMYHIPDIESVKKAVDTSNNFVIMLESLIIPEIKDDILHLICQNPIGYNETKKVYSSIYMPSSLDFFTSFSEK